MTSDFERPNLGSDQRTAVKLDLGSAVESDVRLDIPLCVLMLMSRLGASVVQFQ